MAHQIRTYGDPVLKSRAAEIADVDDRLVRLTREMFEIMYEAPGIGLAAPQIGVQKRLFVYDVGDDPRVIVNPTITESDGEWVYEEGCLSIPGLFVEMVRPKEVLVTGWDLDGNEVQIEADELLARLFQHELDHLDGVLMFDRMTPDQRREALAEYRRLTEEPPAPEKPRTRRLRLR
jgi:peptide deformylase